MIHTEYPFHDIQHELHTIKDIVQIAAVAYADNPVFRYKQGGEEMERYKEDFIRDVEQRGRLFHQLFPKGSHIAVLGKTSYEWLCCFLAVMCSENVAVPIDRELREDEILAQLKDADTLCLIYDREQRSVAEAVEQRFHGTVRCIAMREPEDSCRAAENLPQMLCAVEPEGVWTGNPARDDLAAIVFTSGTTGRSKGVMLTHLNLAWNGMNGGSYGHLSPEDRALSILPIHHTLEISAGILSLLCCGVTICINDSLKYMSRNLKKYHPTLMITVPLVIETLYKTIWREIDKGGKRKKVQRVMRLARLLYYCHIDVRRKVFAQILEQLGGNLRMLVVGGAYIAPNILDAFETWGITMVQGYGITECAPVVACNTDRYKKRGSVGKIVPGCEAKIVDGEICVRGPIVMKGYYKNPEMTAEVLADGWFKTGDLGYLDKDFFLYLTGRKKNLIILSNGENVSPEELEQDFQRDASVREVLVYAEDGVIVAEIFPEEESWKKLGVDSEEEYFQNLMKQVNYGRPVYKQIGKVKLRRTEFEKNTSRKIIRQK